MAVSENECKHSLAAIEKISQSKVKLNNKKKPIRDEEESESDLNNEDALTDGEITVDEDDDENNALVIEEQFSSVNKENVSKGKSFSQNVVLASSFNQSNDHRKIFYSHSCFFRRWRMFDKEFEEKRSGRS